VGKNVAIVILSVLLVASMGANLLMGVALWASIQMNAMIGGMTYTGGNLSVVANYPQQVDVGDAVVVSLDITNNDPSPQQLTELDIYHSFTQGLTFQSIQPTPVNTYSMGDHTVYDFNQTVQPGQTVNITVTFQAANAGYFDVWMGMGFHTEHVGMQVDQPQPVF